MRLIDASVLQEEYKKRHDGKRLLLIDVAPTVDAVPVVRCKDCKWFNDLGCAIRIVDESDKPKETDFCSFGERKDGNGNELE